MPSNKRLIAEFVAWFFTPDIPRFRWRLLPIWWPRFPQCGHYRNKRNEIKKLTHKDLKNDRIKLLKVEQKLKKETKKIIVLVSILVNIQCISHKFTTFYDFLMLFISVLILFNLKKNVYAFSLYFEFVQIYKQ